MPKVFRVMKSDEVHSDRPNLGVTSCCLLVRPNDVNLDAAQMHGPGDGGLSVNSSLEAISPSLMPPQYASIVEGAAGRRTHRVWTMGRGAFASGPFAASLELSCHDLEYGVVEPDSKMVHSTFLRALADTQMEWKIVDTL